MEGQRNIGRKVKACFWPDSGNETGRCLFANQHGAGSLELRQEFHGDHDEDWIVEMVDGKEISRHNPRFMETIQWADDSSNARGQPRLAQGDKP